MEKVKSGICSLMLLTLCLVAVFLASGPCKAIAKTFIPEPLETHLSENQKVVYNAQSAKVFIADPADPTGSEYIPAPAAAASIAASPQSVAFEITYVESGDQDAYGVECQDFPAAAKSAMNTAAAIWRSQLTSRVPITIRACWADLGEDSGTLGYSGGGSYLRDFSGATRSNTWYISALANALYGEDMLPDEYDMHITFNASLPGVYHWNFSTDGNVASDEYDFLSVAVHEICHGLGFSGSIDDGSTLGMDDYPVIYDVFTRDTFGTRLLDYDDDYPYTIASAVTSGRIYFHGSRAMAANGGQRVELFTPDSWMSGSSYSHLTMNYYHTENGLMVYMMSRASAIHNPGAVTVALLKDLGWAYATSSSPDPEDDAETSNSQFLPVVPLLLSR